MFDAFLDGYFAPISPRGSILVTFCGATLSAIANRILIEHMYIMVVLWHQHTRCAQLVNTSFLFSMYICMLVLMYAVYNVDMQCFHLYLTLMES